MAAPTKYSDLGTKSRLERGEIETVDGGDGVVRGRIKTQHYIDLLECRGTINKYEHLAACIFYSDWYYGVIKDYASTTPSYEVHPSMGKGGWPVKVTVYESRQDARNRYEDALVKLAHDERHILHATCCSEMTITSYCHEYNHTRKDVTQKLCAALKMLASFYGLING